MGICFFDFLGPNNALTFILLLPVFAYFSQATVVNVHLIWNEAILRRVSTFFLLRSVFLDDVLTEKWFLGWTLFLNQLWSILSTFSLSKPSKK